jgi:hypothetical protein
MVETVAWAILAVWIFNVRGAADLLFAFYRGARVRLDPGSFGPRVLHRNGHRATLAGIPRFDFRAADAARSLAKGGPLPERPWRQELAISPPRGSVFPRKFLTR